MNGDLFKKGGSLGLQAEGAPLGKKYSRWKYGIPFFIIILIIPLTILMTNSVDFKALGGTGKDGLRLSALTYFLTQLKVKVTYLRMLFVPLHQNLDYDYPIAKSAFEIPVIFSFLALSLIILAGARAFRKYRLLSFGIFWFFITLLPESGIIPIVDIIFEHRLYLPMVGYSLFAVSALYYLFPGRKIKFACVILSLLVAGYSVMTYQRNKVWVDELALWNDTVQKSPKKARPYNNRGLVYLKQGRFNQAFLDFNRAIEIDPDYDDGYNDRGLVYYSQGEFSRALSDYNKALQLNPAYLRAYINRGNLYYSQGEFTLALSDYNKALQLNPGYAKAYINRGNVYYSQGELNQALSDYSKAIEFNPNLPEVYNNRAAVYSLKKEYDKAWEDVRKAEASGFKVSIELLKGLKKASGREK